jgi:hypothetical protein
MEIVQKMRTISYLVSFLTGSLLVTNVLASTVTIPNTFVSGQTAVAADVNSNFTALKNAVNDNASKIPVVKDSNAIVIGTFHGAQTTGSFTSVYTILSNKNYVFTVNGDGSLWGYLFFTSTGCSGQSYSNEPQVVLRAGTSSNYVYTPTSAPYVNTAMNSVLDNTGCASIAAALPGGYQTLANDPAITGVQSSAISIPISIQTQ